MDSKKIMWWSGGIYFGLGLILVIILKYTPNNELSFYIFLSLIPFGSVFHILSTYYTYKYFFYDIPKEIIKTDKVRPSKGYGCPKCWDEYEPHIKVCADCNVELMNFN